MSNKDQTPNHEPLSEPQVPSRPALLRRVPWRSIGLWMGTLMFGAIIGAGIDRWTVHPHPMPPPWMVPVPLESLRLTPEQYERALEIGRSHFPEFEAIRKETMPRMEAIHARALNELRTILTPQQQRLLDEAHRRWLEHLASLPPPFPPGQVDSAQRGDPQHPHDVRGQYFPMPQGPGPNPPWGSQGNGPGSPPGPQPQGYGPGYPPPPGYGPYPPAPPPPGYGPPGPPPQPWGDWSSHGSQGYGPPSAPGGCSCAHMNTHSECASPPAASTSPSGSSSTSH